MNYAELRATYFVEAPTGTPIPAVVAEASPARRLRDAFEPLAMHQVWSPTVNQALGKATPGMDFFAGYVWGRAAVLGEVEPAVAASAFAVFEPGVIAAMVQAGRAAISRAEILALLDRETIASLSPILEPTGAELTEVAAVLRQAVEAADGTGRPLFCGVRALGWPEEAIGQMWRAVHALREHRGDSHTAAFVAAGFDPVRMNILTELWIGYGLGDYSASRAWSDTDTATALQRLRADGLLDGDTLTSAGRAVRDDIEAATDRAQQSVLDGIGDRLDTVVGALAGWSQRCIAAGTFPPDFRKRAGG